MLPHYTTEQIAFLQDRKERIDESEFVGPVPIEVALIDKGEGSFTGCLRNLARLHKEIADYAWFAEQDLTTFKLHSYVVAKLMYMIGKSNDEEGFLHEATWFYPLLSDYEPLIRYWLSFHPESDFFKRRIANPNQNEYRYYQMTLALNGQWDEVGRKAEVFLQAPPTKMKKYAPDMRFYLALAQKDKVGMERALEELTSPKVARVRNEVFELTVASEFVSSFACLYAKIARRHGYELDIDTVLIPKEWLPVDPLPSYPDPYDFMRSWTIG
ncbi:MAG: Imm49 family immunity protein [Aquabacterium sp.]